MAQVVDGRLVARSSAAH